MARPCQVPLYHGYYLQYAVSHGIPDFSYPKASGVHKYYTAGGSGLVEKRHPRGHDSRLRDAHHSGVYVNDAEDGLIADIDEWLENLAPFRDDYRHHRTGETNGDSHLKSLIVHHEVIIPVTNAKLDFGPWQQVYYAEFDGQRSKRVIIKVMGE